MGMEQIVVGSRRKIHLQTWARRAAFQFFKDFTEPYHGVCLRVDCTASYRYAKQHHLSVFLTLLHRSLVAAHQVENFRTRIVDGDAWLYDQIHGGSAVGRANGTIGFGHYQYDVRMDDFVREAAIELDRVRQREDIERYPEANLIRYSVLPWFDFTSISQFVPRRLRAAHHVRQNYRGRRSPYHAGVNPRTPRSSRRPTCGTVRGQVSILPR
jgi:chloramphenicol O-acetyltransferase type A